MKKKLSSLTVALMFFGILISTGIVTLANSIIIDSENQMTKVFTISETKTSEGTKTVDINVTWGDFLDSYMKENPEVKYFNPRQDLGKDHRVRVVKKEYSNGFESKTGFFNYALLTEVFDENTGELLSSIGNYVER